jgi:nucleoside-diphosphate-sugar epimerase
MTDSRMFFSWGHVNPIGPRACYDEGKRVAETLTYGFHRQDGVDVRVARIFNTYGPRSMYLWGLCTQPFTTDP